MLIFGGNEGHFYWDSLDDELTNALFNRNVADQAHERREIGMMVTIGRVIRKRAWSILLVNLIFGGMFHFQVHGQDGSLEKGRGLYQRLCAVCHGKAGRGDGYALFEPPPTDLKAADTQHKTDEVLLETIRNGHPNTAMGTWKYALSEEEVQEILKYIRYLGTSSLKDPA